MKKLLFVLALLASAALCRAQPTNPPSTGTGGSPPGGTSGQIQYNSGGTTFGGAPIYTDGTNVSVNMPAVPAAPFNIGAGTNPYFTFNPPGGTFNANQGIIFRPGGTSGSAYVFVSGGPLVVSSGSGYNVNIAYPSGSAGFLFNIAGSYVNGASFTPANAGATPVFTATGSDTNVGLNFTTKGTNGMTFTSGTNNIVYLGSGVSYSYGAEANYRTFTGVLSGIPQMTFNNNGNITPAANGTSIQQPANRTMAFFTSNATALTERMRIDGNGLVGINTTTPAVPLDVNGLVRPAASTFATLPACASTNVGSYANISDSPAPTYMTAATGGGTITAAVICSYNGTAYSWLWH